jgi:hypothetical protein
MRVLLSILLLIAFTPVGLAQISQKKIIEDFMGDMKAGNDLDQYIEIPDSISDSNYIINIYLVEEFEVIAVEPNMWKVLIDSGTGEFCVEILIQFSEYDGAGSPRISIGEVKEHPFLKKLFVNPWKESQKLC